MKPLKLLTEIGELENVAGKIDLKILEIIRRVKPELIEGMDVFESDDDDEDENEGGLCIDGEPRREPKTIFVEKLPHDFSRNLKNILALTSSFKWSKIIEWKRIEENFEHTDEELQVLVTAEGAIRQIFEANFKVNRIKYKITQKIFAL